MGKCVTLNNWNQHRISKLIVKKLFGTVTGKKIFILGFAFKANTNDTRESAAISICKDLLEEGAILAINDPKVSPNQIGKELEINENKLLRNDFENNTLSLEGQWHFVENINDGFQGADAAVILTEWTEYSHIDWAEAEKVMRKPSWVFDSRSIISPVKV